MTTDRRSISIFWLKQKGLLKPERLMSGNIIWSFDGEETGRVGYQIVICEANQNQSYFHLKYRTLPWGEDEWKSMDYTVPLVPVRCNYGNNRWYFQCIGCHRLAALLYLHGLHFVCRRCANLSYESCNENKRYRSSPFNIMAKMWKADELYESLTRTHYRGKPTRKYRRILELTEHEYSEVDYEKMIRSM